MPEKEVTFKTELLKEEVFRRFCRLFTSLG